jgi:hypothetical protein
MIFRFGRFNTTRGQMFGLNITRWFFLTNYSFTGEKKYFVRLGRRGKDKRFVFGSVRKEL